MPASDSVDVIVIGAGPAGEVCAGRLADHGASVLVVERELVGGECSFWGCMPSKALIRPGQLLDEVDRVPGAREALGDGKLDVQAVLDRRTEVVHDWDDGAQTPWLQDKGIRLVRGVARLTGQREVTVGEDVWTATKAVVVASGSRALIPPVDGLAEAKPWTNREATEATVVPATLLVMGGGPIGMELGQAFAGMGATVTIVERGTQLLGREEPFAAQQVLDRCQEQGIEVHLKATVVRAGRDDQGAWLLLADGATLRAEEILVAVGRVPATHDLDGEAFGVEPGKPIHVGDDHRVPGHDWLYAVGDVNGKALLTHMGKYQGRLVADAILGTVIEPVAERHLPPRVTFTDPQVAAVGHTEQSARDAGIRIRVVETSTSGNAGGSFYGKGAPGTARLVVDEDRNVVVGATITGAEIEDFLHPATIAVVGEVPLTTLRHAVAPFPTRTELWLQLLDQYGI